MKGCLGLVIKLVIAVLIFFGLLHLGVIDFIKEKIDEHNAAEQSQILDKTKDVVDLSGIDEEYTIEKNLKILKNRMIIAEHNATGQKMIMIEPKDKSIITKADVTDANAQAKIEEILKKYKYKLIKFDKVEVVKRGQFYAFSQQIPYLKIEAVVSSLPVKDMEGIVGVANLKNGKELMIISLNEKGKYSQIITEAFYKKVK